MDSQTEPQHPERLLQLLREQRELYRRLRQLAEQQRGLISRDRPEALLNILRERQTLVASLARLNEQLAPFRRRWDGLYEGWPEEQRRQASALLQEINGLLRVILQTDQEDSALLSVRKQALGQRMQDISGGQAANSAYARQTTMPALPAADVTG